MLHRDISGETSAGNTRGLTRDWPVRTRPPVRTDPSSRYVPPSGALTTATLAAILAFIAAFVMGAFDVGIGNGLLCAGAAVLAYSVPATLFGWPRITFDDLVTAGQTLSAPFRH